MLPHFGLIWFMYSTFIHINITFNALNHFTVLVATPVTLSNPVGLVSNGSYRYRCEVVECIKCNINVNKVHTHISQIVCV